MAVGPQHRHSIRWVEWSVQLAVLLTVLVHFEHVNQFYSFKGLYEFEVARRLLRRLRRTA